MNDALEAPEAKLIAEIVKRLGDELPELLRSVAGGYKISIHILPGHKEAKIEFQPKIITIRTAAKNR